MREIPITDLFPLLERYNGMVSQLGADEAPIAPDPLNSDDPLIRAAAEEMAAKAKACASQAA